MRLCANIRVEYNQDISDRNYKRPGWEDREQNHCSYSWADVGPCPRDPLWSLHWWTITILHRPDTRARDYQLPSIGLPAHAPSCDQWPVMAPVIQSNHFTPEQHFDASEDYWTTTGSVVKLSPGLMFQRGYLSMSETNLQMAKPLESGHLEISSVSSLEGTNMMGQILPVVRNFQMLVMLRRRDKQIKTI